MTPPPFSELLSEFRRASADHLRELRGRRFYVRPAERRRIKAARARKRARQHAMRRPLALVIRPIKHQEVTA